jgi:hypothetical protein|tara:strand:- start:394 stop:498 length:105 start_codon:yes stop_codon:yes gene_type:complete
MIIHLAQNAIDVLAEGETLQIADDCLRLDALRHG